MQSGKLIILTCVLCCAFLIMPFSTAIAEDWVTYRGDNARSAVTKCLEVFERSSARTRLARSTFKLTLSIRIALLSSNLAFWSSILTTGPCASDVW